MDTFSKRLNLAMEMRNIKQVDLVEITGITKGAISSYANGDYVPKQINTYKIAKALNVNPTWLMGKNVDMELKSDSYYADKETDEAIEMLHKNPELRILLDATSGLGKEDIDFLIQLSEKMKGKKD